MNAASTLLPVTVESFAKLAGFIKAAQTCMFTTVTTDGSLHSRPLLTREVDVAGHALWFFAVSNFSKVGVILDEKPVALSYAAAEGQGYVSVSGRAHVVHDKAKTEELWTPMAATRFPKGVDDPRLILLRVDVEAVEYWDSP
jgi:general stress protein 26